MPVDLAVFIKWILADLSPSQVDYLLSFFMSNLANWIKFSVVCTLIISQNVVNSWGAAEWVYKKFWSLWLSDIRVQTVLNHIQFPKLLNLILTVSMNAFHSTNLFCCFSPYQAPANSVAPPSVYKPHTTHNSSIRSDEGLTLETSAFESLYGG